MEAQRQTLTYDAICNRFKELKQRTIKKATAAATKASTPAELDGTEGTPQKTAAKSRRAASAKSRRQPGGHYLFLTLPANLPKE